MGNRKSEKYSCCQKKKDGGQYGEPLHLRMPDKQSNKIPVTFCIIGALCEIQNHLDLNIYRNKKMAA